MRNIIAFFSLIVILPTAWAMDPPRPRELPASLTTRNIELISEYYSAIAKNGQEFDLWLLEAFKKHGRQEFIKVGKYTMSLIEKNWYPHESENIKSFNLTVNACENRQTASQAPNRELISAYRETMLKNRQEFDLWLLNALKKHECQEIIKLFDYVMCWAPTDLPYTDENRSSLHLTFKACKN